MALMQTIENSSPVPSRRRSMYVPRLDLYGPVHKGLRWALTRVLARLGGTSPTRREEAAAVLDELETVLAILEGHIAHEEAFVHPAIEARCPGASRNLEHEHEEHEAATAALRVLVSALRSGSSETLPALWRALYLRFAEFVAENFTHMAEEEEVIQPLLEELYTTEELLAIEDRLRASIPPEKMLAFARFMLPANDPDVRFGMLAGMKAAMPAEAFPMAFAAVTVHLAIDDIRELTDRLAPADAE